MPFKKGANNVGPFPLQVSLKLPLVSGGNKGVRPATGRNRPWVAVIEFGDGSPARSFVPDFLEAAESGFGQVGSRLCKKFVLTPALCHVCRGVGWNNHGTAES